MSPVLISLLPFLGALLPAMLHRSGRGAIATGCGLITLAAFAGLLAHVPAILAENVVQVRYDWLPALGLDASFRIDGLGLLFATLILGIGLLIILYARFYLSPKDSAPHFFTYLMLFQGAMTGLVLSGNVLLLLVFWELTSLSSFLLIGFWSHQADARQGARMALVVTGTGGLALIAGMLILGHIAGSHELAVILTKAEVIQASPLYLPALILILIGAFSKSAQFPFHFWLPHAMAAPTPVSAYLHSATMVKAGLFVMARLWPVLSGTPEWFWIVASTGLITMLIGAVIACFQDDLKGILAYSTVSHLGLITMLLGFGTQYAALAAIFHIINHATFKAALFMTSGMIDHGTGTRSAARLGGLRRLMPVSFAITTIAALSMAGIPPLNGFISKEMMLENTTLSAAPLLFMTVATFAALFSVCYSLRLFVQIFLGRERDDYPVKPHDPSIGMWIGPAFLAALVVLIGLMPNLMAGWLVESAATAVTGQAQTAHLALWHGINPALMMSAVAVLGGILLLGTLRPVTATWLSLPRLRAKAIFDGMIGLAIRLARALTDWLQDGTMARALAALVLVTLGCGAWAWMGGQGAAQVRPLTPLNPVAVIGWVLAMSATVALLRWHPNRFLGLLMVSVIGLMVAGFFAYFSAPDLALTQISVEVVTVLLMLLALNLLPKHTPAEATPGRQGSNAFIAALAGLGFGGLAYAMLRSDFAFASISGYMLENSYKLGGGTNVVNVILVDFRGYDTFGEITVLGIAALTIFALCGSLMRGQALSGLRKRLPQAPRLGRRENLMLQVATRAMLPVALVVGLFIFLRGHNLPGGGFVAGLVASIALLMQYMASGPGWTERRQPLSYHALIGAGVIAAVVTGAGGWVFELPFLTSAFGYVKLPGLEEFELATAMGFDLGVFLCVLGAVMLALNSLCLITDKAHGPRIQGQEEDR